MADLPGSKRARWTARLLGIGSTVALLSLYGWLSWAIGTAKEGLRNAETKVHQLEVKRGELEGQIKELSTERDSLKEKAKRVDEQLETKKAALEEKEKLIEGLRVAAENASPGEVHQPMNDATFDNFKPNTHN